MGGDQGLAPVHERLVRGEEIGDVTVPRTDLAARCGVSCSASFGGPNTCGPALRTMSDDFYDDFTAGPVLVHHGVRFLEPFERKTRS